MRLTDKLIGYLHQVFSKDPDASLALRLRYDGVMTWRIEDGVLTTNVTGGSGTALSVDLSAYTIGELVTYLTLQAGYTVQSANIGLFDLSALALLDGDGDQGASNGDYLMAYGSLMRAWLDAEAVELEQARIAITEMLRQMTVTTAESEWLDELGGFYAVPRNSGETDARYGPRIIAEVLRPRGNNIAIEMAIVDVISGFSCSVDDADLEIKTRYWRADGEIVADGSKQAGPISVSHYGQFDVTTEFDLVADIGINETKSIILATVEKFRDAGTRLRQLNLIGSTSDQSDPSSDLTAIVASPALADTRPPIRLMADGTVIAGGVVPVLADGTHAADGALMASGYTFSGILPSQVDDPIETGDLAGSLTFGDAGKTSLLADGKIAADGSAVADGLRWGSDNLIVNVVPVENIVDTLSVPLLADGQLIADGQLCASGMRGVALDILKTGFDGPAMANGFWRAGGGLAMADGVIADGSWRAGADGVVAGIGDGGRIAATDSGARSTGAANDRLGDYANEIDDIAMQAADAATTAIALTLSDRHALPLLANGAALADGALLASGERFGEDTCGLTLTWGVIANGRWQAGHGAAVASGAFFADGEQLAGLRTLTANQIYVQQLAM